jgi:Ni/Co efflux regulator RcnB
MRRRFVVICFATAVLSLALVAPAGGAGGVKAKSRAVLQNPPDVGAFGDAAFFGSTGPTSFNQPLAGIAGTKTSRGYWEAAVDGAVFAFGDARFFGSMGGSHLNQPIVGIAATRTGNGYWLVARDGGIFTFGDARFFGSMGGSHLNQPIVGIAATRTGNGYWLVASDGGVFTFGDARFFGSMGGSHLNQPVAGIAATPVDDGYWLAAADGGIFTFGHALFMGSVGDMHLDAPVVGIASTPVSATNNGYWMVGADGRRFSFGRAFPVGDKGGLDISRPIVGIAPTRSGNGYWLVGRGTRGTLPGQVTVVRAGHGGGSGELAVDWSPVPGATGYRVLRSTSPTGPFSVAADVNVTTGKITHAPNVDVFSFQNFGALHLQYVEVRVTSVGDPRVYFHVTAYNGLGEGPPSVLVCGTPVGYPDC